ncbi:MAG: prenyltransferase/squalene oxidase repeat-containing protein [Dehalococcoidales bacterium]|nr:prenyltransferase/squalene oxidase repeat-containing protein [Dehalococcoidales bacterium]
MAWTDKLQYDPIHLLIDADNGAIRYLTTRDLLDDYVPQVDTLWNINDAKGILKRQKPGGYWVYPGKSEDYRLLETFKNLQSLVYKYQFNRSNHAIEAACEYLLSYQTYEGDIRGFIGNQYAPYYTGLVTVLLISAGYEDDTRIIKALEWLLSVRQNDGGWVIGSPGITGNSELKLKDIIYLTSDKTAPVLKPYDKSKPFSHSGTGMVIRAFAAHPQYRTNPDMLKAAYLLKSQFFKEDNYNSYKDADHWLRFQYPFWWNNLVAALDSLSLIGILPVDNDIINALEWLISKQEADGLWKISYSVIHKSTVNKKSKEQQLWITLAICRIFKRFYNHSHEN